MDFAQPDMDDSDGGYSDYQPLSDHAQAVKYDDDYSANDDDFAPPKVLLSFLFLLYIS